MGNGNEFERALSEYKSALWSEMRALKRIASDPQASASASAISSPGSSVVAVASAIPVPVQVVSSGGAGVPAIRRSEAGEATGADSGPQWMSVASGPIVPPLPPLHSAADAPHPHVAEFDSSHILLPHQTGQLARTADGNTDDADKRTAAVCSAAEATATTRLQFLVPCARVPADEVYRQLSPVTPPSVTASSDSYLALPISAPHSGGSGSTSTPSTSASASASISAGPQSASLESPSQQQQQQQQQRVKTGAEPTSDLNAVSGSGWSHLASIRSLVENVTASPLLPKVLSPRAATATDAHSSHSATLDEVPEFEPSGPANNAAATEAEATGRTGFQESTLVSSISSNRTRGAHILLLYISISLLCTLLTVYTVHLYSIQEAMNTINRTLLCEYNEHSFRH